MRGCFIEERQVTMEDKMGVLRLHDFNAAVADGLCRQGKLVSNQITAQKKRGRPSNAADDPPVKKSRISPAARPVDDVRLDRIDHWPLWDNARQRCKMASCNGFSHVQCGKCKIHLCFTSSKNCFCNFHSQ